MAKRIVASLLALLLLLVCLPISADGGETARDLVAGIERYKGANDRQAWLDGELTDAAGKGAEWYALALIKCYPTLNYTKYEAALRKALSAGSIPSSATKLKCALVLACLGSSPDLIRETLDRAIGDRDQLMCWVFGLHLLNAGYEAENYTAQDVAGIILGKRNADGGWSVTGTVTDVDVTAMTLQALAPQSGTTGVAEAIDGALALLSSRQLPDGGFESYGVENAESSAMVLIALACLDRDAETAGFAGGTPRLLEGLAQFAAPSGGFCHKAGDDVNALATAEAFFALSAYLAHEDGKTSVYLPDVDPGSFVPIDSGAHFPFLILYISVPALTAAAVVLLVLRKKKQRTENP